MPAVPYPDHTPSTQPPLDPTQHRSPSGLDEGTGTPQGGPSTPVLLSGGADAIDWFETTLHPNQGIAEIMDRLPVPEPWEAKPGTRWYNRRWVSGPFTIQTEHRDGTSGPHLTVPGDACRYVAAAADWPYLLDLGEPSRLDVFLDDHGQHLDLDLIANLARSRHWSSTAKVKAVRTVWESAKPGAPRGLTVYAGSRASNRMLRIYDKAAETGTAGPWVRVELQTRNELSQALQAQLRTACDAPTSVIAEHLARTISFKTNSGRTRTKREAPADWWTKFLRDAQPAAPLPPPAFPTFERCLNWVNSQVAPTLAFVIEHIARTAGDNAAIEWLCGLLEQGNAQLEDHHLGRLLPQPDIERNLRGLYRNDDLAPPHNPDHIAIRIDRKRLKARIEATAAQRPSPPTAF